MSEVDPTKVVAVFENLFGKRFGRWVATGVLALTTLALSVWLIHVIWKFGGRALYERFAAPPTIDLAGLLPAVQTMMFMLIVYSAILLGVLVVFVRRVFRTSIPQSVLDQLAEIRSRVIHEILNAKVVTEIEFNSWKHLDDKWRDEVIEILKRYFPRAETLGFERLGVIQQVAFPQVINNEHAHRMMMFAKRLSILEDIIKRYSR